MLILPVLLYTLLRAGASPTHFRAGIRRSPSGCPFPTSVPTSFPTKVVYQSPDGLFFENIAVRSTSQLLLTSVTSPSLHMLDPTAPNGTLTSVFTFQNSTSLTGIAELDKDVFAIAASVTDNTTRSTVPGSVAIWRVDFTGGAPEAPSVTPLAVLTQALSANGLSALPGYLDVVLAADSAAGEVWQVNARTGASRVALQDPSMDADAPPPTLGINGLHVHAQTPGQTQTLRLFFSTSGQSSLSSVPLAIDAQSGNVSAAGAVETLASFGRGAAPDDFALDDAGRAWVAVHPGELVLVAPVPAQGGNGTQIVVAGNSNGTDPSLDQPTSAAFGRGSEAQAQTLYVTTGVGQVIAVSASG